MTRGSARGRGNLRADGDHQVVEPARDRWVEVSPSQFPHEAEGLELVRATPARRDARSVPGPTSSSATAGAVARGRPARARARPAAPDRAQVLLRHAPRRRPPLAPRRPPRRGLAAQARPPQGAVPQEQARRRARRWAQEQRVTIHRRARRRPVRPGVGVPASPWTAVPAARCQLDRPLRARRQRAAQQPAGHLPARARASRPHGHRPQPGADPRQADRAASAWCSAGSARPAPG